MSRTEIKFMKPGADTRQSSKSVFQQNENKKDEGGKEKLAIDVGGVLLEKRDLQGADTNFDLNNVIWVPGSIDAVKQLAPYFDLYILSFCGKKTEAETRIALRDK